MHQHTFKVHNSTHTHTHHTHNYHHACHSPLSSPDSLAYQTRNVGSDVTQPLALGLPLRPDVVPTRLHALAGRHAPGPRTSGRLHNTVRPVLRPERAGNDLRPARGPRRPAGGAVSLAEAMEHRGAQGLGRGTPQRRTSWAQLAEHRGGVDPPGLDRA